MLHFASPASPIDYLKYPIQTLKVGALGTHHALGLAKDKQARFLLASTSEVYGDPQVHPQPETYWGHVNPIGPRGVYDEAKRFAEALAMAYHRTHGVQTCASCVSSTPSSPTSRSCTTTGRSSVANRWKTWPSGWGAGRCPASSASRPSTRMRRCGQRTPRR